MDNQFDENDMLVTRALNQQRGQKEEGRAPEKGGPEKETSPYERIVELELERINLQSYLGMAVERIDAQEEELKSIKFDVTLRATALNAAAQVCTNPDDVHYYAPRYLDWLLNGVPDNFAADLPPEDAPPVESEGDAPEGPGDAPEPPETGAARGVDTP